MPQSQPHDEFLELCAISTSGQLSEEEQGRLEDHLAICASCRQALLEYRKVLDRAVPAMAASEDVKDVSPGPGWSQKSAEKEFFKGLARQDCGTAGESGISKISHTDPQQLTPGSNEPSWRQVWSVYGAGILLFVTLGFYAYRVHFERRPPPTSSSSQPLPQTPSLEEQLSDIGHEREVAQAEVRERDQVIAVLRRRLAEESAKVAQLKAAQDQTQEVERRLESDLHATDATKQELIQRSKELEQKLSIAEDSSRTLQGQLDFLGGQSDKDAARARVLETKNKELTTLLKDREAALEGQEQLLAHDKDIRDLMGARDLYIAEVYDIARTGETKKPYGRVFYTRGKSLIFYAYDLDQDIEARNTNAFQGWGRRGPDREEAVNLGIFYEDNLARKRWILKCEDTKALAQIDGVFVTVEPTGGSHRPSGRSLLFAYLKLNPNHP